MNPKERFLKMPQAKLFADIASSEPFQLALDYAMLEMQRELPAESKDMEWNRITAARLNGAAQLRRILETIALPDEMPQPVRSPQINYHAYNKPSRSG